MPEYTSMCSQLAERGLKPKTLPTMECGASGIGGVTHFELSCLMPAAVCKQSGTIVMHVIPHACPCLLPISFCTMLGMVLDMDEGTVRWKKLQQTEYFQELPSGHIAIDLVSATNYETVFFF